MSAKSVIKRLTRKLSATVNRIVADSVTAHIVNCDVPHLLDGKVIMITGATGGLGMAFCRAFLGAGASVILAGRDQAKLKSCVETLTKEVPHASSRIASIILDQLATATFKDKLAEAISIFGRIDQLVNNAGTLSVAMPNTTEEVWDRVIDTNLKSAYFLSQLFITYLRDNGIKGNILNVSSSSSIRPGYSPYNISKWGINALTLGLAKLGAPHGITVNAIAPGPTATSMLKRADATGNDLTLPTSPIGRYAHPIEIANMAVMLLSEAGRTIVGDTIYMTGGAGLITIDDETINF